MNVISHKKARPIYNIYRLIVITFKAIWYLWESNSFSLYNESIRLVENNLKKEGLILDKTKRKRFFIYSVISAVFFNAALRTLTNKKLTKGQQAIAQYFAILTPIIDDLSDDFDYSSEELKNVCQKTPQRVDNIWEKIAFEIEKKIQLYSNESLWRPLTEKVLEYQIQSKKQVNGTLDDETLRKIIFEKGGLALKLNYEVIAGKEHDPMISKGFYGLGIILQLTNDTFDIFKDRNNQIQTLATHTKDIYLLRNTYNKLVQETFEIFFQLPYNKKNIHDFLLQMMVFVSRCWVAFDHLEQAQKTTNNIFLPHQYTRKQLVTDMEKLKNLWRSLVYHIKFI